MNEHQPKVLIFFVNWSWKHGSHTVLSSFYSWNSCANNGLKPSWRSNQEKDLVNNNFPCDPGILKVLRVQPANEFLRKKWNAVALDSSCYKWKQGFRVVMGGRWTEESFNHQVFSSKLNLEIAEIVLGNL